MAVLSVAMAVPMRASERLLAGAFNGLEAAVGSVTVGVGLWVLVGAAGALY